MQLVKIPKYYTSVIICLAFAALAACNKPAQSASGYIAQGPFETPQERRQLFEKLGIEYTPVLKFADECPALAKLNPEDYSAYKGNEKKYNALTAQYGPEIARGHVAPVSIYYIKDKIGYGVAANKDFKQGDFIAEYTGKVVKKAATTIWTWTYHPSGGTLSGVAYSLEGSTCGNELRFVNHSDDPNVEIEFVFQGSAWHIIYVAKKHIPKGKQLLVSYGSGYWSSREKIDL